MLKVDDKEKTFVKYRDPDTGYVVSYIKYKATGNEKWCVYDHDGNMVFLRSHGCISRYHYCDDIMIAENQIEDDDFVYVYVTNRFDNRPLAFYFKQH